MSVFFDGRLHMMGIVKLRMKRGASTEEQAGKDHYSIDAQLHEMRDYASEKGWSIVGEFIDEGESGTKHDCPQLTAARSVMQKKGCDIFLVHELSRLSRSVCRTLDIFDKLGQLQVSFASVKDPKFDFSDPRKRFLLPLWLPSMSITFICSDSTPASQKGKGRARGSISPLGHDLSGDAKKPAVINEEEALIIHLIFESYASGRYSDQEIAHLLN